MTRELLASVPTAIRPAAGTVPSAARSEAVFPSAAAAQGVDARQPGRHLTPVDVFVAAGLAAHRTDQLGRALEELAVRLEVDGAGGLLSLLEATCWTPHEGVCPSCGGKRPPDPHPKPPKPPTKPPKGQGS